MIYQEILETQVYTFILIFARTSAVVAFAPLFGAKNIPGTMKAMIAFSLSIVFTGILAPLDVPPSESNMELMLQLAGEVTIGAAIGFAASIVFEVIIFAGYIIDYMIGFGFISIVDPQSGASISLFAFFYSFFGLLLFLSMDGHHILIEAMVRGYELIPPFTIGMHEQSLRFFIRLTSAIFYTGFQMSGPIFIVMFMIDFTLGMIGKTVPQLQILVVGFPIKISLGLIAIALALKPMANFMMSMFEPLREQLMWLFKYMGGGQ